MAACLAGCIGHTALCHQKLSNPFHNSCHWLMIPAPLSGLRETSMTHCRYPYNSNSLGCDCFLRPKCHRQISSRCPTCLDILFQSRSADLCDWRLHLQLGWSSVHLCDLSVPLSNCPFPERTPKTVDDFFFIFPGTKITIQDKTLGTWSTAWESSRKMGFPMTSPNLWRQGRGSWGVAQS